MQDTDAPLPPIVITCPFCKVETTLAQPLKSTDDFQSRCLAFLEDGHGHADGQLNVRGVPILRPAFAVRMTGQS